MSPNQLEVNGVIIPEGVVVNHTPRGMMARDTAFSKRKLKVQDQLKPYVDKPNYKFYYFVINGLHIVRVVEEFHLKFIRSDDDNMRCYYRNGDDLLCIHHDGLRCIQYKCTDEGEPCYEAKGPDFIAWRLFPLPLDGSKAGGKISTWLHYNE